MADIETFAVATDGTPIARMEIIDKDTGNRTPVNVSTCAEGVTCNSGKDLQKHLEELHVHANDDGIHLTADQKANMETTEGAQAKATAAKTEAIAAASLLVEAAKSESALDASTKAAAARDAAYRHTDQLAGDVDAHKQDTSNPHNVTAAQVGLGNVPNKSTNDQQPTFKENSSLTSLVSGEKLTLMLGKIAKAISTLISHLGDKGNPHKVTATQTGALPTTGGTMTGSLTFDGGYIILKEGMNYGTQLPAPGVKGRIFFKVVE